MGFWSDLGPNLLQPMYDAVLAHSVNSPSVKRHAESFPGALEAGQLAAQRAANAGFAIDSEWMQRFMSGMALDRQDVFSRLMGRSLISSQSLAIDGLWPRGKFVALGLHWGAGFPVLEHLIKHGHQPAFLYRSEDPAPFDSLPKLIRRSLHMRALNSFGQCISVGGAYEKIKAAIEVGRVPVALFDAPAGGSAQTVQINVAGYLVRLRRGLLHLLAEQNLPFAFYRCGLDPSGSRSVRILKISEVMNSNDLLEIAHLAASFFIDTLNHDAAQWHFWPAGECIVRLA